MVASSLVIAIRSPGRQRRSVAIKSTSKPVANVRRPASTSMFAFDRIGKYYSAACSASTSQSILVRRSSIAWERQQQ